MKDVSKIPLFTELASNDEDVGQMDLDSFLTKESNTADALSKMAGDPERDYYGDRAFLDDMMDTINNYDLFGGDIPELQEIDLDAFRSQVTSYQQDYTAGLDSFMPSGDSLFLPGPRRNAAEPIHEGAATVRDFSGLSTKLGLKGEAQRHADAFLNYFSKDNRYHLTLEQSAYILATAFYETGGTFNPGQKEIRAKPGTRVADLQNKYYDTGYYGRGLVQLTHKENYKKFSDILGTDLVNNPDQVHNPEIAYKVLVEGMVRGLFTGKKLADFINPSNKDFRGARRVVNGLDQADKIASLATRFMSYMNGVPANNPKDIMNRDFTPKGSNPFEVAKSLLGATEDRDSAALGSFFERTMGTKLDPRQTAWCAAFVNATLKQSGVEGTNSLMARSFLNFGDETKDPTSGDIVVLKRTSNPALGHVGFLDGIEEIGGQKFVRVLGGNQNNSVSVKKFLMSDVLSFRKIPSQTSIADMGNAFDIDMGDFF